MFVCWNYFSEGLALVEFLNAPFESRAHTLLIPSSGELSPPAGRLCLPVHLISRGSSFLI